jgi:hypothetical protein
VLVAVGWYQHVRLVNRHLCPLCHDRLSDALRAEYVRAGTPAPAARSPPPQARRDCR